MQWKHADAQQSSFARKKLQGKIYRCCYYKNDFVHPSLEGLGGLSLGQVSHFLGFVDASGKLAIYTGNSIAYFRGEYAKFLVCYDGSIARFGYEQLATSLLVFVAETSDFIDDSPVRLSKPITEIEGLVATDWYNSNYPKLNGEGYQNKAIRALGSPAIAPDREKFLLETD